MNILIQVIGTIGILIKVVSIQKKEKSEILAYQGVAFMFISLQYFLLGVYTPASLNVSTSIRSFIFRGYTKNNKTIPIFWLFIFLSITLLFAIFTWNGYLALIPIINTSMYVISTWVKDAKWLRICFILAALLFMYYNFSVGAYTILAGNLLEVISGTNAVIKYDKKSK
ncbi:MAG: YgjV family protein [Erysipelotrichales bacterium]|nr:YgjV family protein [Erysipelotrichales bacterium]